MIKYSASTGSRVAPGTALADSGFTGGRTSVSSADVQRQAGGTADVQYPPAAQVSQQLRGEVLRETGLHLSGPAALGAFAERLIERSSVVRDHDFRTSIEDTCYKVQATAAAWSVEVLMPETGQFLIGDNPALTLRTEAPH
ncbi:hypothetical protein [Streptomyces sp. NPDC056296]|uniref:hypothetical protein n=1 Tax=Streptomyces sp. NPDC056296 TaxID=3345775 RepID=UPI0035DE555C